MCVSAVTALLLDCPPRLATPRDPARPTLGGEVAEVAETLGTPLMPWQQQVVDVALEVDPDTGRLAYREVIVTTPRQQGKTTLELAVMVHRARRWPRSRILYSAQSRLHAHKKWEDEHVATLNRSPLAAEFTVRYQRGDEAIRWRNGSLHGITAPGEKSGHSEVLDLMVMDEAWALEDARLEQGVSPTMVTRPEPQLWVVSTAGTRRSAYLRGKVDRGRARVGGPVTARDRSTVAYFEWSALPDSDPADPATWHGMPALGRTITEQTIAAEFERLDLADFCRAYLNWEPNAIPADWLVIAEQAWRALADPSSAAQDPVAFAADVTPERSHAAIAVAGLRADGLGHGEVVDHRPGTGWVVPRLVELVGKWRPCAVVVDDTGPAGNLIAPLEAAGIEVTKPTGRGMAHAAGDTFDAVAEQTIRIVPRPALDAAVAGAAQRPLSDGWAWARKGLSTDICPLVALSLARWGWVTRAHLADRGPFLFVFD